MHHPLRIRRLFRRFRTLLGLWACGALLEGSAPPAQATGYNLDFVTGPVSPVYEQSSTSPTTYNNSGWFPDSHFPLLGGGPNNPSTNLSFWIPLRTGFSMDDAQYVPGAEWIPGGAYGSGDYRGYWVTSVIRPTDYVPALLGTSVNLTIYTNDNSSSSVVSHVIDNNYLIGFCHVEDYDSSGNVVNNSRTIYSFDNGLTWSKGPWSTPISVAVDTHTTPGSPRLVAVGANSTKTSTDFSAGATWTSGTNTFDPGNFAYTNSLFYNHALGVWMIWYGTWGSTDSTVNVAVSTDLINWQSATSSIPLVNTAMGGAVTGRGNYPTLLGSLPPGVTFGNYDTESSQLAWLYNNIGGLGGRAIYCIHPVRQDITWSGSGNLDSTGNWTVTGGGSFPGFSDEAQSLTFSSSGGSLNNDIPTTQRVRGFVFKPGAGSFTVSGNTLELEAYAYGSGTYTSIGNFSASTQTFNSNIDVRTAALYLDGSAGPIVINGAIDMRGSGGILVYGSANTSLNGAISDSGYTDFTTGTAEYIADANEGRLVMQGTGTLTLGGTNTFAGRTDVLSGVVCTTSYGALQDSVVTFNTDNALVLGTDSQVGGLNGIGNLALGGVNLTLGNNNPANCYYTRYSGIISGAGSVTKTNANTQRIGAVNTYTGGTNLNGGVLEVPGNFNTALGTGPITFNGGSLSALGAVSLGNAVVLGAGGASVLSNGNAVVLTGNISGSGSLVTDSAGSLTLSGTNSYSGGTVIKNAVQVSSSGALGTGSFSLQGGTLQITNNINLGGGGISVTATGSAIDTGSFTLTSSGPISVASGQTFLKEGTGTFLWSGPGTAFSGDFDIDEGTVMATQSGTYSLTAGNILLGGSTLSLSPGGSGGNVVVNLAGATGNVLDVAGLGILALNPGGNSSLTVNVGAAGNPNALVTGTTSVFLMTPSSGTAALGSTDSVFAPGTAATPSGTTFAPNVLVTSGIDGQGDFATYSTTAGFTAFTGYTARTGTYSQPATTSAEVANITGTAKLSANSYAQGLRISGTNSLNLNGKSYTMNGTGTQAGVILNSGTITSGTLSFGANRGYIYTGSAAGSSIASVIAGSGGVSVVGVPGSRINLTATSTFTGGLIIDGATLEVSGSLSMGDASNAILVDGQGVLVMPYTTTTNRAYSLGGGGGSIQIPGSYDLIIANPVTGSGDWHKQGTGTLQLNGNNTYTGSLYIDSGCVAFNGRTTFYGSPGTISVASGAYLTAWTWGSSSTAIANNLVLNGTGIGSTGALSFSGGGTLAGTVTLAGNTVITAGATTAGTFTGSILSPGYNLTFIGTGTSVPFVINGSISLGSGTLTVSGTGGVTLASSATGGMSGPIVISNGSILTLDGEIDGTSGVTIGGTLAGTGNVVTTGTAEAVSGGFVLAGTGTTSGRLTISGNFALDAGAEYDTYVYNSGASTSGNAGYGQVVVLGSGSLAGTLRLYRGGTYTPAADDQLFVALRNGGSGAFSQVIVMDGGTATTYSGAPGTPILIGGVTGTLEYNAHSSQALTSGNYDVVIQF